MFRLISFDMDGTLLNSRQTVSVPVCEAVSTAAGQGKQVVLCTGRSVSELKDYEAILPQVRYSVCVSGSLVYDLHDRRSLFMHPIDDETVRRIFDIAGLEDVMIQFLGQEIILEKEQCLNSGHYFMKQYQPLYEKIGVLVDDIRSFYTSAPLPVCKMNLYHTDSQARQRTRRRLTDTGLAVTMKDSETTSLELTAEGVTKALGLSELCDLLQIPLNEVIAVGDADNDLDVLMTAGLPLAMGNAWPSVKEAVLSKGGAIVSDCDHDGCAEAIYRYLLKAD